ncbi:MAG: signal peptide peptidase SppA [Bacteroidales bacterium]|nr:signal peptide peptidase SppA [Bacteroidales bacterium]MBQ5436015.1 signal peptide peptidase SppA [Bacteroidales bacterium]
MKPFWKVVFGGCLGTLIAFVLFNLIFFWFIGSLASSVGKEAQPAVPKGAILKVDISQPIGEQGKESFSFNPISMSADMGQSVSLLNAIRALETAATDPQVKFVYLKGEGLGMDIAQAEEFRAALVRFRESGKPVVAYCQGLSAGNYYLASVADKVILNAYGDVMISGMSSNLMYYKDLIDHLGIDIQLIRHGKYKSAGEPYIKSEMSAENKEQYQKMLGTIWGVMADAVAGSRDFTAEQYNAWIDNLEINSGEDALSHGLVDELWYDDQVRDYFCTLCGVKEPKDLKYVTLKDYATAKVKPNVRAKEKVAVIYADGEIVMDDKGDGNIGNNFAREIAKARRDSSVKAVVFRVNSPGGSVQASAAIEREIALLKQCKPVVASYGGYAASGGYWISCGADKIFTDKSTLTGSIGVFGLIPSFGKALKKNLHLNVYEVATHQHGSLVSGMSPLDPEEEAAMQQRIDATYEDFVARVAAGRGLSTEAVDEIAQGRVWAGGDAMGIGLVDEFGGLTDAIRYAATMAGLDSYRLVEYPAVEPMYTKLLSSMNQPTNDQDIAAGLPGAFVRTGNWLLGIHSPEMAAQMQPIEIILK